MFNGAKPTFGAPAANNSFGFGTANTTASPFGGQSAFGKPATQGFGAAPAFGQPAASSAFGQAAVQQQQQQPTSSLFGVPVAQQSAFGAPGTQPGAFGGFGGQPQQQQQQQQPSLFGVSPQQQQQQQQQQQLGQPSASLFGQPNTSAFGAPAKAPAFGFGASQPTSSLFSQPSTSTGVVGASTGFGGFGAAAAVAPAAVGGGGMFGGGAAAPQSAFGQLGQAQQQQQLGQATGTAVVKYQESMGTDTLMKNGQSNNVNTRQHCITAMKEYEAKSFEELRMEDYMVNRKGPQAGAAGGLGGGMFGAGASGQPANQSLFGGSTLNTSNSIFGQPQQQQQQNTLGGFGAPVAGSTTLGGFGQASAFGQPQQGAAQPQQTAGMFGAAGQSTVGNSLFAAKPFGQAAAPATGGGMFGQPAVSAAPAFGQPQPAQTVGGFGSFGQVGGGAQAQTAAPLFGAPAPAAGGGMFGQTSTAGQTAGFAGFSNPATSQAGTSLFGPKPAQAGFGTLGSSFNMPTTSAATGFGSFGQPVQAQQQSLFNNSFNKPAAPTFGGFGTATAAPAAMGNGLFGNAGATKPSGMFGTTTAPVAGGGLFASSFGGGLGAGNTTMGGGGLGQSTLGMGQPFGGIGIGAQQQPTGAQQIHQQIISMATSPYGDNPIFRDLKPTAGLSEEALKPTNPAAQKALLESSASQFKVSSPRCGPTGALKLKPVGSSFSKKSLFGGLEEFDSSVEESFSLKPNAKRLIIKAKSAATASPSSAADVNSSGGGGGSSHKRLNIPIRSSGSSAAAASSRADDADGSFRNEIPTHMRQSTGGAEAGGRRESWLHSNVLEKVTKQTNQRTDGAGSGSALNSTIEELVGGHAADDAIGARSANRGAVLQERRDNDEQQQQQQQSHQPASQGKGAYAAHTSTDSVSRSFLSETTTTPHDLSTASAAAAADAAPHPCGVQLLRAGYYTIPPLDELPEYWREDGTCRVPYLTIGRRGYGSVYFDAEIDVAGLNLDELVHFRHKEVIIYPDDENKPPVGSELNRKAEVTLDQVWPQDKTLREPIKDRERLEAMDYQAKLRRVCDKHDMRFVDYRPETGSWVFRVEHFSKYGLNDSDDEDDAAPVDPKKAKLAASATSLATRQQQMANNGGAIAKTTIPTAVVPLRAHLAGDATSGLGGDCEIGRFESASGENFVQLVSGTFQPLSPSSAVAMDCGADSHKLQLMKASFFVDDDFDGKSVISEQLDGRDSPDQTVPHPAFLRLRSRHPHEAPSSSMGGSSVAAAPSSCSTNPESSVYGAFGAHQQHHHHHQQHHALLSAAGRSSTMAEPAHHGVNATLTVPPAAIIGKPLGPRSAALHVRPKIAVVRIPRTILPLAISLLGQLTGSRDGAVDVAFEMGRRFRVGWTAPNAMVSLNTLAGCQRLLRHQTFAIDAPQLVADLYAGRRPDDCSRAVLVLSRIESAAPIATLAASIEPHLQLQLSRSRVCEAPGSCPRIRVATSTSNGGNATTTLFAEHLEIARTTARLAATAGGGGDYVSTVWSLCDALWGYEEELDGCEAGQHVLVMRRRELLSDWLEACVADAQLARHSRASYLEHLLDLLYTHRVPDACDLAFGNGDLNLALLLAQLSGGPAVRQLVQHQMCAWQEVQADAHIAPERLRAYMLVAGVSLVASAHGAINIYAELDWLRAFALNVWYLSPATASITDSLYAYERSYSSDEFQAQPPSPPYAATVTDGDGTAVEDVRFHLLKLFSKRSHPLEVLLNPATHTADAMDFRLSWLLLQTLRSIGYRHCGRACVAQLHGAFAAQLEQHGLWQWAIYVLMHLADDEARARSVQTLLYRYVRLSARDDWSAAAFRADGGTEEEDGGEMPEYEQKERFVVEELRVPERWLQWAKAVRAGALGRRHAQAEYLLRSEQWSQAHETIMLHIVPDAIINDNIVYVERLLQRFGDNGPRHIPNWSNQGGLLLEYIRLSERFERLRRAPSDAHIDVAWQQLQQPLSELCSRINLFPCPTAKHRLCQSEIAQQLANLVTGARLTAGGGGADLSTCTLMRVILEKLPLPQEYAKQKLRALLEDGRLIDELQHASEMR